MSMSEDMLNLLNYLYNDFAVSFVICLCGSLIRDAIDTYKNNTKINIRILTVYSVFSTILLCAIRAYMNMDFNIYIFICILIGMWSNSIVNTFTNSKIVLLLLKKLLKNIKDPVAKAISDTTEEIEKDKKESDK